VLPSRTLPRSLERSRKTASTNKVSPALGVARNFIAPHTVFNPGLGLAFLGWLRSLTFSIKVRGFLSGSWSEMGIK